METIAQDLSTMVRTPLHDAHVAAMRNVGEVRDIPAGEIIVRPGDPITEFVYVLEGEIEVLDPFTMERRVKFTLGPTQFMAEIGFLYGGRSSMPMRTVQDTQVLVVGREKMLDLMRAIPEMSDIIITVLAARRRRQLDEQDTSLTVIGADRDRGLRDILAFAGRNRIPVRELDLHTGEAEEEAKTCSILPDKPALIFGKSVVENPTPARIAELMGLALEMGADEVVDVLIVGGGPAGVAAGVYAGAEGLSCLVIEDLAIGGQAGTSSRIENYMGFPTGISGADLCWRGEVQAMKFGTRFAMPFRAASMERREDGIFCITLETGQIICARAVVVATGVQYRRLPIDRLENFEGAGVYYSATDVEARYCRDTDVVIIGGGNSAGQAAMFLSRTAKHVHLLVRGDSLAASMSDYLSSRLELDERITIHYHTELDALHGDDKLAGVTVRDKSAGETRKIDTCGLFIMVGAAPNTDWLPDGIALDDKGFLKTGGDTTGSEYASSEPGIFAVGDVRAGSVKRVASAVGEGSVVISKVWEWIDQSK